MPEHTTGHEGVRPGGESWFRRNVVPLVAVAVALAVRLPLIERYGFHRDEYYFIDCGRHLDFGYVDHPPVVPWIARASGEMLGASLVALRLPAVLASAATVWLTVLLVRRLGGARVAEALAAVAVLIAPAYLRMGMMLDIPVFESLLWTAASLVMLQILDGARPRRWLWVGALAGIGLLTKHTMLLWGASTAVGLLASEHRRQLRSGWLWAGVAVAALVFSPNLVWQIEQGWATVTFLGNMRSSTLVDVPRALFLLGQLLYQHPLAALVWLPGLVHLYRSRSARPLALAFVASAALLLITRAKPYYLSAAYPPLLAGGGVAWEKWLRGRDLLRRAPLLLGGYLVLALPLALLALPVMSLQRTERAFEALLGAVVPAEALTHDLRDMYGWQQQAEMVASVFRQLPPEQRGRTTIVVSNYGEASALNFYGPALGLPTAFSGNMSHFLWGPPPDLDWVVVYGLSASTRARVCESESERGVIDHPLANRWERHMPLYLCRVSTRLPQLWPSLRRYSHGPAKELE